MEETHENQSVHKTNMLDHRSTTAQDFVGVTSAVPLALSSFYTQAD